MRLRERGGAWLYRGRGGLACVVSLLLAGCPQPANGPPPGKVEKPFVGQEVTFSVPAALGIPEEWRTHLEEWSAETGAKYVVREVPGWGEQNQSAPLGTLRGTLALFPFTALGEIIAADACQHIGESSLEMQGLDWVNIFPAIRDQACSPHRDPHFLPVNVPVLVCYYRDDLLRQAGLSPPQTWSDYHELLKKLSQWAPGLVAVEPWGPEFRTTMFLARAAAHAKHPGHYSFLFDIDSGDPLVGSPGFVRGLKEAVRDQPLLGAASRTSSPSDCRREFFAGKAALAIGYETGPTTAELPFGPAGGIHSPGNSGTRGGERPAGMSIGFVRLPGTLESYNLTTRVWEPKAEGGVYRVTVTGFGGLLAGVATDCSPQVRDAAWNAASRLLCAPGGPHLPPGLASICRESHFEIPRAFVGRQVQEAEARQYVNVVAQSLRNDPLVLELPVPQRAEFKKSLSAALSGVLAGKQAADAALASVERDWKQRVQQYGVKRFRNLYRKAVGLQQLYE